MKWKGRSLQAFTIKCFQISSTKDENRITTMRAYIFLIVIFATVCASWAGLLVGPPRPNPGIWLVESINFWSKHTKTIAIIVDYPNKCFVVARTYGRLLREAYSVGTHTPDGKCMKVFCKSDLSYVVHTYVTHLFSYLSITQYGNPDLNVCFIPFQLRQYYQYWARLSQWNWLLQTVSKMLLQPS